MRNNVDNLPWHPISELTDKYRGELLLRAPELVDSDCNRLGVGLGYWQDDLDYDECGYWAACKWSMSNDEWYETRVTPTHFIILADDTMQHTETQEKED